MKLDTTFRHSKVARRIFWLFVVCALLPITAFALLSFRDVSHQLSEQSRRQLRQASHEGGQSVAERLNFLDAELKLIASDIRSRSVADLSSVAPLSSNLKGRFEGLELAAASGERQILFGELHAEIDPDAQERAHMRSGKSFLTTRPCNRLNPCVLMSRDLGADDAAQRILVAEIHPAYLWDAEDIPESIDLCVFDDLGRTLFCSREAPGALPASTASHVSGQF